MYYQCKTIPMDRLIPGPKGYILPLCNKCQSRDCENPIEYQTVSLAGTNYTMRVLIKGSRVGMVVSCEGFLQ